MVSPQCGVLSGHGASAGHQPLVSRSQLSAQSSQRLPASPVTWSLHIPLLILADVLISSTRLLVPEPFYSRGEYMLRDFCISWISAFWTPFGSISTPSHDINIMQMLLLWVFGSHCSHIVVYGVRFIMLKVLRIGFLFYLPSFTLWKEIFWEIFKNVFLLPSCLFGSQEIFRG